MQHLAPFWRLALTSTLVILVPNAALADKPANLLSNGGAEEPADAQKMPPGWFAASIPAPELELFIDNRHSRAGNACLAISNQHEYDQIVCNNWGQEVRSIPTGKTVRLAGYIRTEEAASANICVQCWADNGERLIGFSSTPILRGTQGWTLAEAPEVAVPPGTTKILVRAALTGKGIAYFDDVSLEIVDRPAVAAPNVGAPQAARDRAGPQNPYAVVAAPDPAAPQVAGRIVRRLPLLKDTMILAYMPQWNHGNVDNIGVGNNHGGVQTLLAWEQPAPEEITQAHLRFLLAIYSRRTTLQGKPGPIEVRELLDDWNETTSWQKQPRFAAKAEAESEVQPGEGWKLIDVTSLVRKQATSPRANHGVVLCFMENDKESGDSWSVISSSAARPLAIGRPAGPRCWWLMPMTRRADRPRRRLRLTCVFEVQRL